MQIPDQEVLPYLFLGVPLERCMESIRIGQEADKENEDQMNGFPAEKMSFRFSA